MSYGSRLARATILMEQLAPAFDAAGVQKWVSPDLIQPSDVFLKLSGEDVRQRLVFADAGDADHKCLRPEFTVPLCLDMVSHLSDFSHLEPEVLGYHGEAFRRRADRQSGAFQQAGLEWLGFEDTAEADLKTLSFAIDIRSRLQLDETEFSISDVSLFDSLVASLALSENLSDRLLQARHSGRDMRLVVKNLSACVDNDPSIPSQSVEPGAAKLLVEDIFKTLELTEVGGRTSAEIAERFARRSGTTAISSQEVEKLDYLNSFLSIDLPMANALEKLVGLAEGVGGSFKEHVARFATSVFSFEDNGLELKKTRFSAMQKRKLDYYTDLIFSVQKPGDNMPVLISGGRYDTLFEQLGAKQSVKAVGCAIWLDDIAQLVEAN